MDIDESADQLLNNLQIQISIDGTMADEAANDARGTRRNHDDRDDGYGGVARGFL